MDSILAFLSSGLDLTPDMQLVMRLVVFITVCDVFGAVVQVLSQIAKGVK